MSSSSSSSISYTRSTELRNLQHKHLYDLAVILDEGDYWQRLMEIIPKELNNQTFGSTSFDVQTATYVRKYSNDHIRLIQDHIARTGESRLYSQILFDEWGSSGRKNERPTLGVLLNLLAKSELFRAADFVADLLNEPKPARPMNGPAAEYTFEPQFSFTDINSMVNDINYQPDTEDLQENINGDSRNIINKDYYVKYEATDKKLSLINDNPNGTDGATAMPIPPPRLQKSAKLKSKQLSEQQRGQLQQQQQQSANSSNGSNANNMIPNSSIQQQNHHIPLNSGANNENMPISSAANIPDVTGLLKSADSELSIDNSLPNLSIFENAFQLNSQTSHVESSVQFSSSIETNTDIVDESDGNSEQHDDAHRLPTVLNSMPLTLDNIEEELQQEDDQDHYDLPVISELNINGEQDDKDDEEDQHQDLPAISELNQNGERYNEDEDNEDDDEDDGSSIPNISFLDNRSSNNESSLTSVTNTSGDNSFEQSVNDFSSTSADNVPYLSDFNQ